MFFNKFILICLVLVLIGAFALSACSKKEDKSIGYSQITAAEAKELMNSESDYVIIDARTEEEYREGHIPGAILIPEYEIADRAEKELHEKERGASKYHRHRRALREDGA